MMNKTIKRILSWMVGWLAAPLELAASAGSTAAVAEPTTIEFCVESICFKARTEFCIGWSAGQPLRSSWSPAQARPHRWPSQQKTNEKTSKQASRRAKNQWKEQATFGQTDFAKNDFGENWDRVMSQDNINIKKKCLSLSGMFSANGSIVI